MKNPDASEFNVDLSHHWTLDPGVTFINHGSFGACPKRVLHEQDELRALVEREPLQFMLKELTPKMNRARHELARFVGADPAGVAFVDNATTGVNTVLRSLEFGPEDEILVTSHGYPACNNAVDFVARRSGAQVAVAQLPFPLESPQQVLDAILEAVTDRTSLALVDHITSSTGLVLPIEAIVEALDERGVETLVDGAHAPGMVDLDISSIGATYYTGNCHKWLCAPKGAAFLWVCPERRADIRPLTISHGASAPTDERSRYLHEFDWTGTQDFTPYLCVPRCIGFLKALVPGGWPGIRERNRNLALEARDMLCDLLEVEPPAPDEMIGMIASVPLPDFEGDEIPSMGADPLQTKLFTEANIEVQIFPYPQYPGRVIRISAQLYNDRSDYEHLCDALGKALAGEPLREDGELPVY
ncbi:MAG: aminotransferase class V-fold PLP-dependent enzyme [Myxococcota bacterium]